MLLTQISNGTMLAFVVKNKSRHVPGSFRHLPAKAMFILLKKCSVPFVYAALFLSTFSTSAHLCNEFNPLLLPGQSLLTFMAEGESPLLARLDTGHPQVTVVDKGHEAGVPGADFGVHAGP